MIIVKTLSKIVSEVDNICTGKPTEFEKYYQRMSERARLHHKRLRMLCISEFISTLGLFIPNKITMIISLILVFIIALIAIFTMLAYELKRRTIYKTEFEELMYAFNSLNKKKEEKSESGLLTY